MVPSILPNWPCTKLGVCPWSCVMPVKCGLCIPMMVKQQNCCAEAFSNSCWVLHAHNKQYCAGRVWPFPFTGSILAADFALSSLNSSIRLVKLAMVCGCSLGADQSVTAANKGWPCLSGSFVARHLQQLLHNCDVALVVEREKHWILFKYFQDDSHSTLMLFRTLQPLSIYVYTQYLSEVKCF